MHFAVRAPRCEGEIDDRGVRRIFRIERELDAADQPLVSARRSERAFEGRPRQDGDARDFRLGGTRRQYAA